MKLKCKKCGNEEYFYEKARFTGDHHVIINSDGTYNLDGMNFDAYNYLYSESIDNYIYCNKCNSIVCEKTKLKK